MTAKTLRKFWMVMCFGLVQVAQAQGFNRHYDAFSSEFDQGAFGIEPTGLDWMIFSVSYEPDTVTPDSILGIHTIILQKIDAQGELLAEKKFKIPQHGAYLGWANCCDTLAGGGFVSGGSIENLDGSSEVELVRYSPQGDTLWTRTFGDASHFWIGSQVKQTPDEGFLVCGYTDATGNTDGFVLKTDSAGNELWRHTYGAGSVSDDYSCITLVPDGYVLSGRSHLSADNFDFWVTKIDTSGTLQWDIRFGSPYKEPSPSILYLQDGRLLLGGGWGTDPFYFETPYVVFIDPANGDTLYSRKYGATDYITTIFVSKQFPDSDIIHAGVSYVGGPEQGLLLRTTSDGDSIWMRNYFYYDDDVEQGQGRFFDVLPTADNGCIATGFANGPVNVPLPPGHSQDTWVVKVDSMGCVVPGCDGIVGITEVATNLGDALHLYPNPVREQLHVGISLPHGFKTTGPLTLSVTSLEGKLVQQVAVPTSAAGEVVLDVSGLASGMYALHLSDAQRWLAGTKFVVE
jgi:hypothetical protein